MTEISEDQSATPEVRDGEETTPEATSGEARWRVVLHPVSENPAPDDGTGIPDSEGRVVGKNKSGLAVCVTDGREPVELARVAFARRHAKDDEVPFKRKLRAMIDNAQAAVDAMNGMMRDREEARAEAERLIAEVDAAAAEAEQKLASTTSEGLV